MNKQMIARAACAVTLGAIGTGMLIYFAGWGVAAGVLLMIWGNNLDRVNKI